MTDSDSLRDHPVWQCGPHRLQAGTTPLLMGILNVTPDSFSDGGQFHEFGSAIEQGILLAEEGADIIDVGGESTRPGATPVGEEEELRRVIPVIEHLAKQVRVPISIDTMKSRVAREALAAGANIVNDVSGGTADEELIGVCAETGCGVCVMHMQGTPRTMQINPHYDDVVGEVVAELKRRMQRFIDAGVGPDRICLDPGIGFGKTSSHNVELLRNLDRLRALGHPVLIGHSRKRFLKTLVGREIDERLMGTVGVSIALAMRGVDVLRVHDVRRVSDALRAWSALVTDVWSDHHEGSNDPGDGDSQASS